MTTNAMMTTPLANTTPLAKTIPLTTFTGRQIYPHDLRPEDIRIEDIAAALSKLCRYGGHCLRFYSVAEHCVHVASKAPDHLKLCALLHDASEGLGLVDLPTPSKARLAGYYDSEHRMMTVIAAHFGFDWPMPDAVKALDTAIIVNEWAQNMPPCAACPVTAPALGVALQFWTPEVAERELLTAFYHCR
jgi:hypothetical protein